MWFKSPLYYTGNKYLLLGQIVKLFPDDKEIFIDAFGGSGVVAINIACMSQFKEVHYNELEIIVFEMFKYLTMSNKEKLYERMKYIILGHHLDFIGLNSSVYSEDEQKHFFYTYRSYVNKELKEWGINNINIEFLYVLSFFSFANSLKFNKNKMANQSIGVMGTTFGNRILNDEKFYNKFKFQEYLKKEILLHNTSYENIEIKNPKETFIYFDPPYANTGAEYNKRWNLLDDKKLFSYLDTLTIKGVKWGMSNVFRHNGVYNVHIKKWAETNGYSVRKINKKYSLGKKKASDQHSGMETAEVYISNYKPKSPEQLYLF